MDTIEYTATELEQMRQQVFECGLKLRSLDCGCEYPFHDEEGRAVVSMRETLKGDEMKCPDHGWQVSYGR